MNESELLIKIQEEIEDLQHRVDILENKVLASSQYKALEARTNNLSSVIHKLKQMTGI